MPRVSTDECHVLELKSRARTLREFANEETKRECRSSRVWSRSEPWDLGGHAIEIHVLQGKSLWRKPKEEVPKIPKT
jgi:hypothetical protein